MSYTTDPAVLTWMIALAPRPRPAAIGSHWWREMVTDAWRSADQAWWLHREAVALGYPTEMREFEERHPRPRLGDFMVAMSVGRHDPEAVLS